MTIGEMEHRISFLIVTPIINENGFESDSSIVYKTVWAAATNLHGKEYFAAMAVQSEKAVKFTIRHLKGLDRSMKILFEGKTFDIIFIDNIKYKHHYLEILASEVDADGQN